VTTLSEQILNQWPLIYKKLIVIYDRNYSGQYYKTTITIVFMILAKAKASLSWDRKLRS